MAFVTTTTKFGNTKPQFAWSYTKIKNYRTCPLRYFHYDVAKDVREPPSDEQAEGFAVHDVLKERVLHAKPLPAPMAQFEPLVQGFLTGAGNPGVQILAEQKWGIREDLTPCKGDARDPGGFFARDVWYRAVADAVKISGDIALNWDWKTGKVKEDPLQIILAGAVLMIHNPQVQAVRNEFIWLNYGAKSTIDITRAQIPEVFQSVMPEVIALQLAHETNSFPPKKNNLCREWCGVVTCQYNPEY